MRAWDSYVNLDATVKNMLTSLRAVAELQNPSLRERHWGQLLVATKTDSNTKDFVVSCRMWFKRLILSVMVFPHLVTLLSLLF